MTPERFAEVYPRMYHMADAAAWPSIQKHGLLSTSALLDLYGITGEERDRIERTRRPEATSITHADYGQLFITDQRPMTDATLGPALIDMTPAEWYAHLNARVFFWVGEARLERLLNTYRERDKFVLVLDTAKVMARHAAQTMLSPINSGFSLRYAQKRGRATFLPLADYPFEQWVKTRGRADAVAECTILGGVPNVEELLVEKRDSKPPRRHPPRVAG